MKLSVCCCLSTEIKTAVTFIAVFHWWSAISSIAPFVITIEPIAHLFIAITLTVNVACKSSSKGYRKCTFYFYIAMIGVLIIPLLLINVFVIGLRGWNCPECADDPKTWMLIAAIYIVRLTVWCWFITILKKYSDFWEEKDCPQPKYG